MTKNTQSPESHDILRAARDVLEWAEYTGGWDAPCWERLRQAVRETAPQTEAPDDAQDALRRIYDLLYLDTGPEGNFHNPDKTWSPDTLDAIADVVRERFQ